MNLHMTNREIIIHLISVCSKSILLIIMIGCIVFQLSYRDFRAINNAVKNDKISEIKTYLQQLTPTLPNDYLNDVSRSIKIASDVTNINDTLITSVAYYESRMNKDAKSSAGYKGIMQATTHDVFEFAEVDVLRGAKKMQYWISYRKGDIRYALASYNGGVFPPKSSYDYADKVIQLSRKLQQAPRT